LFAKLPNLRIVVNNGAGMGNQAAAINLVKKFRSLKYTGDIELVYICDSDGWMHKRLHHLLPNDPKISVKVMQASNRDHQTMQEVSYVPLCFTVSAEQGLEGNDFVSPEVWNCDVFINLKLHNFSERSVVPSQLKVFGSDARIALPAGVLLDDEHFPVPAESVYPSLGEDKDFLQALLQKSKAQDTLFQSVYGLFASYDNNGEFQPSRFCNPVVELSYLINALFIVQKKVSKPIVILIHSPLSWFTLKEIHELLRNVAHVKFIGLASALNSGRDKTFINKASLDVLTTLQPNEILVCYVSWLQQDLFNSLILASNLPPVVEGANCSAYLEAFGRPYLHGGSSKCTWIEELSNIPFQELQKLHINASKVLEGDCETSESSKPVILAKGDYLSEKVICLASFILKALCGELNEYFNYRKESFHKQPDLVATVLSGLDVNALHLNEIDMIPKYMQMIATELTLDIPEVSDVVAMHFRRLLEIFANKKELIEVQDFAKFRELCTKIITEREREYNNMLESSMLSKKIEWEGCCSNFPCFQMTLREYAAESSSLKRRQVAIKFLQKIAAKINELVAEKEKNVHALHES
jgi:hypothetical protein